MKIAFVVNDLERERPGYTTTLLAQEARRLGHDALHVPLGGFSIGPGDRVTLRGHPAPPAGDGDRAWFLDAIREAPPVEVELEDVDVVWLRNDPADDADTRPWATHAGVVLGQIAASRGAHVVNDPFGLARALTKLYAEHYPEDIRPRTLVTRDAERLREFVHAQRSGAVLKPLSGSGGRAVFHARRHERSNLNQMIETVLRDGYVVAQEFLPEAAVGDVRVFMVDGELLEVDGYLGAVARVAREDDIRSNLHAGGHSEPARRTPVIERIAAAVGPGLVRDGMFFVGLDIGGERLLEINVFSPGGLVSACDRSGGARFGAAVIRALERRHARR